MRKEETITTFTTTELQAELKRREEIARRERLDKHDGHVEAVRDSRDELLRFVTEHSRSSCSDRNPVNASRQCVRCALLELSEDGDFPFYLRFSRTFQSGA